MWHELLGEMAHTALARARDAGLQALAGSRNRKGDAVRAFDVAAHDALLELLDARLVAVGCAAEVLSEEGAPQRVGRSGVQYRIVIDPVDGSDNAARGLPLSAFACAVLPADAPLDPTQVLAAIVAPVEGADYWLLDRTRGLRPSLRPSNVHSVSHALVSVELNHLFPSGALANLLGMARGVRSYGCCSRALMLVAAGALDAHIDIRARLTPESWLAAAAILHATGAAVALLDAHLQPAAPPCNLHTRHAIVAAATPALLDDVLARLKQD